MPACAGMTREAPSIVMRGLDPRIHQTASNPKMDCRVKPGNDD
jgi:hypothetical protein